MRGFSINRTFKNKVLGRLSDLLNDEQTSLSVNNQGKNEIT